jgi:hypothetical protein
MHQVPVSAESDWAGGPDVAAADLALLLSRLFRIKAAAAAQKVRTPASHCIALVMR